MPFPTLYFSVYSAHPTIFLSSFQCNLVYRYSVIAFHIHPQSTFELHCKLLSSENVKKKHTFIQGNESSTAHWNETAKLLFYSATWRQQVCRGPEHFSTKDSSTGKMHFFLLQRQRKNDTAANPNLVINHLWEERESLKREESIKSAIKDSIHNHVCRLFLCSQNA